MYLPSMAHASSSDPVARSGHWRAAAIARSVLFNLGLWSWTAVMLLGALPWLAFPPRLMLAHSRFWMRGVQFLLATIVGLEYEVRGRASLPGVPPSTPSSTSPPGKRSQPICWCQAPPSS